MVREVMSDDFTGLEIKQSMSKAGCPYDNSSMESFYGTFKAEFIHKHRFSSDEAVAKLLIPVFLPFNLLRGGLIQLY